MKYFEKNAAPEAEYEPSSRGLLHTASRRFMVNNINFEKKADFDEWLANRKEDWEAAKYLAKHKYYVYKGGKELGAPTWPLLRHDITKLKPSIWVPYREFFHGGHGKDPEIYKEFRKAVAEHAALESHHDYKYKNKGRPGLENFADWWSVSKSHDPRTPDNY
jgi:hypothetical protein